MSYDNRLTGYRRICIKICLGRSEVGRNVPLLFIPIAGCIKIRHGRREVESWEGVAEMEGWGQKERGYQELTAASRVPITAPVIPRKRRV